MAYFALSYEDLIDDYGNRRVPFRGDHLERVRAAHARGELLLAGALGDPADGALLVFKADDAGVAERFAREDPYVLNGLVGRWRVRPWAVVIGGAA